MSARLSDQLWRGGRLHLGRLLFSRKEAWAVAAALGWLAALGSIGLLALSGWFITAAGLAGMVSLSSAALSFNYFGPSAIIRLFAIVRTAGRYGERLASHHAVLSLLADLRSSLFARLAVSPQRKTASMRQMHRLTGDIDLLNMWPLSVVLPWLWALSMLALIELVVALSAGALALWILPPLVLATVVLPLWAAKRAETWAARQADEAETRRLALLRPLSALTALLQWQQWPRFERQFCERDAAYMGGLLQQQQMSGVVVLLQQVCLAAAWAVLLWRGGLLVASESLTVAMLLAMLLSLFGFAELVLVLGMQTTAYGLSKAACNRLNELAAENHETEQVRSTERLPETLHLCAQNVSARLPGALNGPENVSFDVKSGEIAVLSGASGAGKSTLLAVLAGELDVLSGSLKANGQPLSHWQWQGAVAYLGQQPDIFDLTLAQNLRLGKADASDEELWAVLEKTALADWVRAQPAGLDTPLGEYGAAVSGGQARRIALARFLLKPYALMLLDEPFAGLDAATAERVAAALADHQKNGVLVAVSHYGSPWAGSKLVNIDLAHVSCKEAGTF